MADWQNIRAGLRSGIETGMATGGKLSSLGISLKNVASKLKSKRETGEALDLLGQTEDIKQKVKAQYTPTPEYKPKTKEEKLDIIGAEADIKNIPSNWDIQKEARTTVNAMINQNSELQDKVFDDPTLMTDLIDKESERLKVRYSSGGTLPKPKVIIPDTKDQYGYIIGEVRKGHKYVGNNQWQPQ